MKYLRKFNEELESEGLDTINDLKEIFENGINVPVFLEDLLSGTGIILVTTEGKVFEKSKSGEWKEYESPEAFKNETGASLDEEYVGSKSQQLLNLITGADGEYDGIDDYRVGYIESIYFDDEPTDMLKKLLRNYD
jgi:hypothetical protein